MRPGPLLIVLAAAMLLTMTAAGQQPPAGLAQRFAPIDLTGIWVSIVTEDWAVRMIPPPKGDFESLPLTAAAREVANRADIAQLEAAGRACDAYGAPVVMREPGRVRISWENPDTLRIDTDAGEQTRLLYFGAPPAAAAGRQGASRAEWQYAGGFDPIGAATAPANPGAGRGGAPRAGGPPGGGRRGGGGAFGRGRATAPTGGKLKVVTTNLTPGLLRKNGVPYSGDATVVEYYNLLTEPGGQQWFVVTTIVHDPVNLAVDYITSTNFRKEPDAARWRPRPCSLR